jgi:hypothetical protein
VKTSMWWTLAGGRACRRKEQRGWTRSREIIRMQKKEERCVVAVMWDRQVKKEGEHSRTNAQQRNGALNGHGIQCID